MRGVIMLTKGKYAVLLTKSGDFVKVKNKNYSIGDTVSISSNAPRICAMAASLFLVLGGISSYFIPTGYISVDINPSLMMTVNIYDRVINTRALNDDAEKLLAQADVRVKNAEDAIDILIKKSEEIGYINDNNKDIIIELVSVVNSFNPQNYGQIEVSVEKADREDLRNAQKMGVSIAKAKALEEYTEKNGGDMHSNAAKFNDKSVKEIRNIMLDNDNLSDKKADDMSLQNPKPQEIKPDNISKSPKSQGNYRPLYNINNNSFPIGESKREDKSQEIPPEINKLPHWDITQISQPLHIEPKPSENVPAQDKNILQNKPQQTGKPEKEKSPVESIQKEQKHQDNVSNQGGSKPQNGNSKPNKSEREDNKPSDNGQQITEQQPQDSIPNNPIQSDGQKPDVNKPSDKQQPTEQKPKQKNNTPSQAEQKPSKNVPAKENPIRQDSEQKRNDGSASKAQSSEQKPQNDVGNKKANEGMGGHKKEMT